MRFSLSLGGPPHEGGGGGWRPDRRGLRTHDRRGLLNRHGSQSGRVTAPEGVGLSEPGCRGLALPGRSAHAGRLVAPRSCPALEGGEGGGRPLSGAACARTTGVGCSTGTGRSIGRVTAPEGVGLSDPVAAGSSCPDGPLTSVGSSPLGAVRRWRVVRAGGRPLAGVGLRAPARTGVALRNRHGSLESAGRPRRRAWGCPTRSQRVRAARTASSRRWARRPSELSGVGGW